MESTPLRKNDILASNLLFGALALMLVTFLLGAFVLPNPAPTYRKPSLVVVMLLVYALMAVYYYKIRQGRRWTKVLYVVLFVLGVVFYIWRYDKLWHYLSTDPLYTVNFVVGYPLQIWALVLLFKKPRMQAA